MLQKQTIISNQYHKDAIEDGVVRLLSPAVVREIRSEEADEADDHGIGVFSENLKNLLMTLIDNHIGCHECPYYDMCNGTEDLEECAELFIDQIAKKEL